MDSGLAERLRSARRVCEVWASAFDQPDFAGAWTLPGFFLREFDSLAFAQQLEDRAAHRAAVEEVLDSRFVADESEPLVDQEAARETAGRRRRPAENPALAAPARSAAAR